jgi:SAM-dependent methyltransferase
MCRPCRVRFDPVLSGGAASVSSAQNRSAIANGNAPGRQETDVPTILSPSARRQIERILGEDPRVQRAAIVDEEGPDRQTEPVAYVVVSPSALATERFTASRENKDKKLAQWQMIFNQTYRTKPEANTAVAPSFVGWNSSYTNKPIAPTEMQEWLDNTVERIVGLAAQHVLEIGCGVGLLVQRLAPQCRTYRGTDLSPIAVQRLREFVAMHEELRHVELSDREATNFTGVAPGSIDLVVLNSVVQYFPDLDYLLAVLGGAAQLIDNGHIFVGDVRHFGLLPAFHSSVAFAKASPEASIRWLRRRISLATAQERELVIDPGFFLELPRSIPRITGVEVLLKRGRPDSELTRYRYDVVLHVEAAEAAPAGARPAPVEEWRAGAEPMAALLARLVELRPSAVLIRDVPNSRVADDLALMQMIAMSDAQRLIRDLPGTIPGCENAGSDPELFWQLDPQRYDVRVSWPAGSDDGRFDVALVDRRSASLSSALVGRGAGAGDGRSPAPLASDPLAATFMRQLGLELGDMLRAKVDESMLPSAVIVVDQIPH